MRGIRWILAVLACIALPAQAVNPGEVSGTAEATCAYRAIGAQHPDPKLRNLDDFAVKLCRSRIALPRDWRSRHLTGTDGKPDGRMIDWHRIIEVRVP